MENLRADPAQLGQRLVIRVVVGITQQGECYPYKVEVVGSSPTINIYYYKRYDC